MRFLGIDLGWQTGPSGLCCLELRQGSLHLLDLQRRESHPQVLDWVDAWVAGISTAVIAVDAPTLIPNATGMRLPDRLAHKYFGKYHAGAYPANLGRPFAAALVAFGLALETRGFEHCPHSDARPQGRFQLEVFPHPVTVHLFRLERIIQYKKGRLAERRQGLAQLRSLQLQILPTLDPGVSLTAADLPPIPSTGAALKAVEDQLDALTCAYAAAHWWYWGLERNWVLGDRQQGYIVVAAPYADQKLHTGQG